MFGATRTPDASGSPGMVTAALTGSPSKVARQAIGNTPHWARCCSVRASLRSEREVLRFMG